MKERIILVVRVTIKPNTEETLSLISNQSMKEINILVALVTIRLKEEDI